MSAEDGRSGLRDAAVGRVTGGGQPIRLPYADALALAEQFDRSGARMLLASARTAATATDPDLLLSAPLATCTAVVAEAAVLAAATALSGWSVAIASHADAVRRAVALLCSADRMIHAELLAAEAHVAFRIGRETVPPDVTPTSLQVPMSAAAPTSLEAMAEHAGQVSALSDEQHPERNGTIEVQTVTAADGGRRHVVYLPGMDDLGPSHDDDVRDWGGSVHLAAGLPTAYGAGVLDAMHQAGVRPGEPVLLVGHSQGGMQAVALAGRPSPYDVTDVVTLGSPAVAGPPPTGVEVLSLEHVGDPVPLFDMGAEVPSPQQVRVAFHSGDTGAFANHGFLHYTAGAMAVQESADPTVQHAVHGLDPFLAQPGDTVESTIYQIRRHDDPLPGLTGSGARTP